MRTDELVALLARSPQPAMDARAAGRRFSRALLAAALVPMAAVLLLIAVRGSGQVALLALLAQDAVFWVKLGFASASALAAAAVLNKLGHPGVRGDRAWLRLALPYLALWVLAVLVLAQVAPGRRAAVVMTDAGWKCALGVTLLSAPALAVAMRAMRALAPTRLNTAGAVAGLFAGSTGAFAYALLCTEMQLAFVAVWYPAGILVASVAGALLGSRLLRW